MGDRQVSNAFKRYGNTKNEADVKQKPKRETFSVRAFPETKELLDELLWLKQFVVDKKTISQGEVVTEALKLLAKKINYDKLKEEHAEELANATITAGRKQGR